MFRKLFINKELPAGQVYSREKNPLFLILNKLFINFIARKINIEWSEKWMEFRFLHLNEMLIRRLEQSLSGFSAILRKKIPSIWFSWKGSFLTKNEVLHLLVRSEYLGKFEFLRYSGLKTSKSKFFWKSIFKPKIRNKKKPPRVFIYTK